MIQYTSSSFITWCGFYYLKRGNMLSSEEPVMLRFVLSESDIEKITKRIKNRLIQEIREYQEEKLQHVQLKSKLKDSVTINFPDGSSINNRIKITQCSDFMFWYRDSVGSIFTTYGESIDCYWVRDLEGYNNIVMKKDCELCP